MYEVLWIVFAVLSNELDQGNCETTCAHDQCPKSFFHNNFVILPDKPCYDINDEVSLNCSGNMGGPPENICKKNSSSEDRKGWALPGATCEVFTCAGPVNDNLILTPNKTTFGARSKVTFSCKEGYELTGPDEAVCDKQDIWNPPTFPTCLIVCLIPEVDNGKVTSDITFKVGDTATVTCHVGFTVFPSSSSKITCRADGTWNTEPVCLENCVVAAVNHSDHTESIDIKHDGTLEIVCNDGYSFDGRAEFHVKCNDSQLLGNINDSCLENCVVAAVNNSDHTESIDIKHDGKLEIVCNDGYSFDGRTEFELKCNDGQLSGNITAACLEDCAILSPPPNGKVSENYRHGTTATYKCSDGYSLNGTEEVTCDNGDWNNIELIVCYETSTGCDAPPITDASLSVQPGKLSYNINDTISYSCSNSKDLDGPTEAICSQDGEWNPSNVPVCEGNLSCGVCLLTILSSVIPFFLS